MATAPAQQSDAELYRSCVLPFVVFIAFNLLLFVAEGTLSWDHPSAPWWRRAPEMWIYPVQTLVCAGYLWRVRRSLPRDGSPATWLLGALCGVVGIAIWLIPYVAGLVPDEGGFDPAGVFGADSAAVPLEYALRFARAAVVVPFVEELFWRGFLMRWCINRDFPQDVPLGSHSWPAYLITTLGFMLVHVTADYPGAFIYGSIAYLLVVRTRQLMPVIVMHAVANLIMGIVAVTWPLPQLW